MNEGEGFVPMTHVTRRIERTPHVTAFTSRMARFACLRFELDDSNAAENGSSQRPESGLDWHTVSKQRTVQTLLPVRDN